MSGPNGTKTDLDDLFRTLAAIRTLSDPIYLEEQIVMPATEISLSFVAGSGCAIEDENDGREYRGDDWGEDGGEDRDRERCGAAGIVAISPMAVFFVSRKCSSKEGVRIIAVSKSEDRIPAAMQRVVERAMGRKTGTG